MPYAGPQIFVFTAGNADARAHLADSIEAPVVLERALAKFPSNLETEVRQVAEQAGGLYAWGAVPGPQNTPRWGQMRPGDWVLCVYAATYRFAAKVIAKYDNASFAREVWGVDPQGRTWNLMYFLTKPQPIDLPLNALAENLNAGYMGFSRIGDEKLETITQDFGSVDQFIATRVLASVADIPDGITREDVLEAIRTIDGGEDAGFGESTTYDLLFENRRYPPKMVLGLAARRILGRALRHTEFSGGEQTKCFRVLRSLGFEIVPKLAAQYFLVRSNTESPYDDRDGKQYHFTNTVPNSKKLREGGYVAVDRRTPNGPRLFGYGLLDPAKSKETEDGIEYEASFRIWTPFSEPREITDDVLGQIQVLPGYNQQHAIRPINKEIYERLTRVGESGTMELKTAVDSFAAALEKSNVSFGGSHLAIARAFIASLVAKPFVILTGLSGSGKTQIALRFGEWLGDQRLHVTAVRPDWTGAEALFGYEDALRPRSSDGGAAWTVPEPLEFLLRAANDPASLYTLLLDEMNLAHVERYFADVLSGMESGQPCLPNLVRASDGQWRLRSDADSRIPFPGNVFVIGTVNVDETTYMFSPKVLDRSNTFEFRVTSSDLVSSGKKPIKCVAGDAAIVKNLMTMVRDQEWHIRKPYSHVADLEGKMRLLHRILAEHNFEYGHRVFFESTRFAAFLEQGGDGLLPSVLDRIVMQKILPRLHGSRRRLEVPLLALAHFARALPAEVVPEAELRQLKPEEADGSEAALPTSFDKICRMLRAVRANQFASFTE